MPRRNRAPRSIRKLDSTPAERPAPTTDALARRLVARGLASPVILGPTRRSPSDFITTEGNTP